MGHGFREVASLDIAGGGQVVVAGGRAYVGHMDPPAGTSILDVSDPRRPRVLGAMEAPLHTRSHKVRLLGDLMLVNRERSYHPLRAAEEAALRGGEPEPPPAAEALAPERTGLEIYDVRDPARPRLLSRFPALGVHRFDVDERYAYLSAEMDGYRGNITVIVDLARPEQPVEVGRWWLPGQWAAGGERGAWEGDAHMTHHPLRRGDRLYVSLWYGGFAILDISDLARPALVSHVDWSPPYPSPTHTALRLPFRLRDRDILVVADEQIFPASHQWPPAFLWIVDVTDERHPVPIASYRPPDDEARASRGRHGCHQPQEQVRDPLLFVSWFAGGVRAVDVSDPHAPREVGVFVPAPRGRFPFAQSNDVFVDDRGLIYVIDRYAGLTILEWNGA